MDWSYMWWAKMYVDFDMTTGIIMPGKLKSWKIDDVKHPARLISYSCTFSFSPDVLVSHSSLNTVVHQAGFLDGHAEWVDEDRIGPRAPSGLPPLALDWTRMGN